MERESTVTQMGADNHKTFSRVTARDANGEIVWRQRLDHRDRRKLREQLKTWPKGVPVVLEGTFGWGWSSDELADAGLKPYLASSGKVAAGRKARGMPFMDRAGRARLFSAPRYRHAAQTGG